jgi:ketosteroid isomerase-like protein
MSGDRTPLENANGLFYHALETLDLGLMESVWSRETWVRCIHPGWDALVGWEAIRQSWEQIFTNTRWLRVTPTAVGAVDFGDVGLVVCAENITTTQDGDVGGASAQATNVFLKESGLWKLVLHHASLAPVHVTQPFSGTFQ